MSGTEELFHHQQGGGGGSIPPLQLPSKRPHPDSPPKSLSKKEVILVSFKICRGPVGHALYAITVPIDGDDVRQAPYLRPPSAQEDKTIYPIVEIPSDQCPPSMCCVKVKSRLYYLGAETTDDDTYFQTLRRDVYYLDIEDALSLHAANASVDLPIPLKQGVPMIEGKSNCYAFEADGKIYALGTSLSPFANEHQFEVFNRDTGKWSPLPPPPFSSPVTGHARVGHKVVISTVASSDACEDIPYFDLHLEEWGGFNPRTSIFPQGTALFVGDCLYFPYKHNIASLGPSQAGDNLSDLFNNASFASSEVSQHLDMNLNYSSDLMHLGNHKFLYVMGIRLLDPRDRHVSDPDKAGGLRVILFEATGERLCEDELSDESDSSEEFCGGQEPLFRTKLLSNSYFIRRSNSDAHLIFMSGCFPTSMIAG